MHVLPEHLFAVTTGYEDEVVHGFAISRSVAQQEEKEDMVSLQPELLVKGYQALEYGKRTHDNTELHGNYKYCGIKIKQGQKNRAEKTAPLKQWRHDPGWPPYHLILRSHPTCVYIIGQISKGTHDELYDTPKRNEHFIHEMKVYVRCRTCDPYLSTNHAALSYHHIVTNLQKGCQFPKKERRA